MAPWQKRLSRGIARDTLLVIFVLGLFVGMFAPWPGWITALLLLATVPLSRFVGWRARRQAERMLAGERRVGLRFWTGRAEVELPLAAAEALPVAEEALGSLGSDDPVRVHPDPGWITAVHLGGEGEPAGALIRARLLPREDAPDSCTAAIECFLPSPFVNAGPGYCARIAQLAGRALGRAVARVREQRAEHERRLRAEAQLDRARLALLQAQLEPHFIYNTLAHVQLLIRSDAAAADRMTGDLIKFLRAARADAAGETTLARELQRVEAYLAIMRIRMGRRLDVSIRLAPEAAAARIPALLVHTLVENAIKHGIERRPGSGHIRIEAGPAAPGRIRLQVADDGAGLRDDASGAGMGLANLCERLDVAYHGEATFALAPNAPSGVVASVEIPVRA